MKDVGYWPLIKSKGAGWSDLPRAGTGPPTPWGRFGHPLRFNEWSISNVFHNNLYSCNNNELVYTILYILELYFSPKCTKEVLAAQVVEQLAVTRPKSTTVS